MIGHGPPEPRSLGLVGAPGFGGRRIIDLTTASMEAYNYYLKANEAGRNLLFADARKFAERAVAIDPAFASAYALLSRQAGFLLDDPARDDALMKAKAHSAKATEKERLFIDARYAFIIEKDPDKRLRLLKELVDKYPDDQQSFA